MVSTAIAAEPPTFDAIKLGTDYADLAVSLKVLTHRTDLIDSGALAKYVAEFNKAYPNITIEYEGITDFASEALIRLTGSDSWGDIMMLHAKAPFADPKDGTGPYNVYKVLFDAAVKKLIEDDYTTTD